MPESLGFLNRNLRNSIPYFTERTVPELEYSFKHALTQEATYQSILERKRRQFHQRVAEGIEALYRDRVEDFYEELAHHYGLSGDEEKTIDYLLKSGIKAAEQYANQDALEYFNQAEGILRKSTQPHREDRAILHEKRGEVLQFIGQWTSAIKDYKEALKWRDDPHGRAGIYQKMGWLESEEMLNKTGGIRYMEMGLKELPEDDKSIQRVRLEHDVVWAEELAKPSGPLSMQNSLVRYRRAAQIAEEMGYRRELAILCIAIDHMQFTLGDYSEEYAERAKAAAEDLADPATLARVYYIIGTTRLHHRSQKHWAKECIPYLRHAAELSENIGSVQTHARSLAWLGYAYELLGQYNIAIESFKGALEITMGTRSVYSLLESRGTIRIYGRQGREDKVISSFSQIMQALAALKVDEEAQAWVLVSRDEMGLHNIYRSFRDAHSDMGKSSGFPNIAAEVLEDILTNVESRPQKAWYHKTLMILYNEMGDTRLAKEHARKTIAMVDEMGRPDYMTRIYLPYVILDDIQTAEEMTYRLLTKVNGIYSINHVISTIENSYQEYSQTAVFGRICGRIEQEYGKELQQIGINQIRLKLVEQPIDYAETIFQDNFDWEDEYSVQLPWTWVDSAGLSSYSIVYEPHHIRISAASRSGLRFGSLEAPLLSQPVYGDFAIETRIGCEKLGGLFVRKDNNIITLQRMLLLGRPIAITSQRVLAGRGTLESQFLVLRLERRDNTFRAYCRGDGEQWYSCGWTECKMEDPIHVGIFASCSQYVPQAITSFDYFRIYRE